MKGEINSITEAKIREMANAIPVEYKPELWDKLSANLDAVQLPQKSLSKWGKVASKLNILTFVVDILVVSISVAATVVVFASSDIQEPTFNNESAPQVEKTTMEGPQNDLEKTSVVIDSTNKTYIEAKTSTVSDLTNTDIATDTNLIQVKKDTTTVDSSKYIFW